MTEVQRTETTQTTIIREVDSSPVSPVIEQRTPAEHSAPKKSTLLSDILSIIGFAIVFIIIIWGLLHFASLLSPWFSSFFTKPAPALQVSAPAQATSTYPVTISWTYAPSTAGSYAFLYQCKSGLQFATPENNATSTYVAVPCGVAYTVAAQNNSISVAPILSATSSSVADTVSIVFIPKSGSQVQGDATMTISPQGGSASGGNPAKPTTKPTSTKPAVSTQYSGPADLSVRIISENVDQSGVATVSFDIANIGGSSSGSYYFTANLPTAQYYPYTSPTQASLAPGSHIVDTLHFSDVAQGGGVFSVSVIGNDANNGNNYASIQVAAPYPSAQGYGGTQYNYGYNTNYNSGVYTQYPVYPTYTY